MSKRSTMQKKSRDTKSGERVIKPKFQEERAHRAPPLVAKTVNQKIYLEELRTKDVILAMGPAGCGKTYCAAAYAADLYLKGNIDSIVVARPYVQMGKSFGAVPGDAMLKLFCYVRNILDTIKARIGAGSYEGAIGKQIEVQALESIRGRSFSDTFLIVDEAQNSTPEEMKSIVTRMGEHSILVLCGDPEQKDIRGESGLEWFRDFVERHDISNVGIVEFEPEDCVRSGFVAEVLRGLRKDYQTGCNHR